MKWFKHLAGALNDNLIFEAIEKFGGDGYLVFFGTLEIMADEFDPLNPGSCRISIKKLTSNLQLSRQKTVRILAFFDQKAKEPLTKDKSFLVCFEKEHVVIKCNRLAELCDEHTQKLLRKSRESVGSESGKSPVQEAEAEEDIRVKKEEEPPAPPAAPVDNSNGIVKEISETVDKLKPLYPRFNAFSFIGSNRKSHPEAMLHVLKSLIRASEAGTEVGEPFAYARAALKIEEGKYNSRDHERRSQDFKKPGVMSLSDILAQAQRRPHE